LIRRGEIWGGCWEEEVGECCPIGSGNIGVLGNCSRGSGAGAGVGNARSSAAEADKGSGILLTIFEEFVCDALAAAAAAFAAAFARLPNRSPRGEAGGRMSVVGVGFDGGCCTTFLGEERSSTGGGLAAIFVDWRDLSQSIQFCQIFVSKEKHALARFKVQTLASSCSPFPIINSIK
jgi:hypothetical protein